jgi:hypothetical protein
MADYSFLADVDPSDPLSYQSLLQRRKIAEALAGQATGGAFPKNTGEGLAYLGRGLAFMGQMRQLEEAERRQAGAEAGVIGRGPSDLKGVTPTISTPPPRKATAEVPYTSTGAGGIPLPPPRPQIDRTAANAEFQENPALVPRIQAMVEGEARPGATAAEKQLYAASALNRAIQQDVPVAQALKTYTGPQSGGYYPPQTFARGEQTNTPEQTAEFKTTVLDPVLRGADPQLQGARGPFSPTDNASLGVASRGISSGRYSNYADVGGETFATKPYGQQNLADARNRVTQAVLDQSATPPAATASLLPPSATTSDVTPPQPQEAMPPTTVAQANPWIVRSDIPVGPPPGQTTLPSQEPIPPAATMKPPGPPITDRPPIVDFTPAQKYWAPYVNNPNVSDALRGRAKQEWEAGEKIREERQRQADTDFVYQREQRDKQINEYEKFLREGGIENLNKRLEAQNKQMQIARDPLEVEKLRVEIEKTKAEINQAIRTLNQPETFESAGARYERPYTGPGSLTPGGDRTFKLAPGSPTPSLTSEQQQSVIFTTRAAPELDRLDKQLNFGKALTNPVEASLGIVPFGIGRSMTSQAYHSSYDAMGSFAGAFMKMVSGSAVTPSEAMRNLPSITPMVGDTQQDLEDKAARRRAIVAGSTASAGSEARRVIDETYAEFQRNQKLTDAQIQERLPPVRVTTPEEARQLQPGRRIILPDGSEGVVPKRTGR